jgi:hypothetical protein
MTQREVAWISGGTAEWGRQVPLAGSDLKTVGYEADLVSRLEVVGDPKPTYFRTLFTGQDQVAPDGSVPRGYGAVRLEDLYTDEVLLGHVDWFMTDGKDRGTLTFEGGTGPWKHVRGVIEVGLEFGTAKSGESVTSGEPVRVMGFLEGTGTFSFPD